jgi:F0F1-type ATP synthase membrane subunit b/b'
MDKYTLLIQLFFFFFGINRYIKRTNQKIAKNKIHEIKKNIKEKKRKESHKNKKQIQKERKRKSTNT